MVSTKSQIKSLVITGYGINCEYETAYANTLAGAEATVAHINDVIAGQYRLEDYQILNFPGGWSFGDDLGSGKVFVNKLLYAKTPTGPLADQILKFIDDGKLVIGICNGFQILVKMGLLPAFDKDYKTQNCTLFFNDHGFRDAWVKLKVNQKSPCIFTKGIDMLDAPIRHGEGKFIPESRQTAGPPHAKRAGSYAVRGPLRQADAGVPGQPQRFDRRYRRNLRRDRPGVRSDAPPGGVQPYYESSALHPHARGVDAEEVDAEGRR